MNIRVYLVEHKNKIIEEYPEIANYPLPSQMQIENFCAVYKRNTGNNNNINDVCIYIKNHEYSDLLADDEMFFYGFKYDKNGDPIVGDGSDSIHFRALVTTKKMIRFMDEKLSDLPSMFHIDSTFKITKNGFPLVVFGRSDINRQFRPIAFMLTSHEKECDYLFFYECLIQLAKNLILDLILTI